jgi:general secretion pathway protein G
MVPHVPGPPRSSQHAFSLFELCVVLALVAVLGGGWFAALLYYQEVAEKSAVELTVLNLRSGMRFGIAERMIHGSSAQATDMLQANPLVWLEKPPPGYAGEIGSGAVGSLPPGSWFFDAERREAGYLPRLSFHLTIESAGKDAAEPAIRWRVRGVRAKNGEVEDVSLVPVTRYRWF